MVEEVAANRYDSYDIDDKYEYLSDGAMIRPDRGTGTYEYDMIDTGN